jgi:hypothetical protein
MITASNLLRLNVRSPFKDLSRSDAHVNPALIRHGHGIVIFTETYPKHLIISGLQSFRSFLEFLDSANRISPNLTRQRHILQTIRVKGIINTVGRPLQERHHFSQRSQSRCALRLIVALIARAGGSRKIARRQTLKQRRKPVGRVSRSRL